jgi:hypothetical protein
MTGNILLHFYACLNGAGGTQVRLVHLRPFGLFAHHWVEPSCNPS